MIGSTLGPYELRAEVGSGGMATVYRAYQPSMDREVAIKVIHATRAGDQTLRERFRREARLIARLEHPNILPVYDFDGTHEPPYIVMRYLDQGTLRALLTTQPISLLHAASLLGQIAAALDYAHALGVVHRDIKPSNILLDRHGNAFVSDFGIARIVGAAADKAITGTGAIIGTPDYISPEQARGRSDIDGRADVYALGVLLFQMLTGQLPFNADQPMAVILQHLQASVPSAHALNPQLPAGIDMLLAQALAKEPADRLPTAGALAEGFETLLRAAAPRAATTQVLEPRTGRLEPTTTPTEQQRVVTVVAADAAEYGTLISTVAGGDAARAALHALWERGRELVEAYGGRIVARREHAALALWGAEAAHEDDAEQAIKAAYALQSALRTSLGAAIGPDESLPLAVGVHTGPVLLLSEPLSGALTASGVTITVAERLAAQADGSIRISHDTFRQVRGVFDLLPDAPLRLRGRPEPLETYQVTGVKAKAFRVRPRGIEGIETPLIGREAELRQLQDALLTVFEEGETQAVYIVGEAGIGKSRLLDAFDQWADLRPEKYWFFTARATPAMQSRPYALLNAILAHRFEIADDASPEVARLRLEQGVVEMLGTPDPVAAQLIGHLAGFDFRDAPAVSGLLDDPRQLAEHARHEWARLVRRISQISPIVFVLDDVQHADQATLELLDQLLQPGDIAAMIVLAARPSLLERRSLRVDERITRHITLLALDRRASRELARALLSRLGEVPRDLRDLLVGRAGGNPLYLEELVRMLLDERVIVRLSEERWALEPSRLNRLTVPPTLYGLLQARLDSLLGPERLTLQRAAVLGQTFFSDALIALDTADDVHLANPCAPIPGLVARGLLETRMDTAGSEVYGFTLSLLRDLLYSTLLERQRRIYHRAAADWMAQSGLSRAQAAVIADHYARGSRQREAGVWYRRAGDHANQTYAVVQAQAHYREALALLPDDEDLRGERLACYEGLGEAQSAMARLVDAIGTYRQMAELAELMGDTVAASRAYNGLAYVLDYSLDYTGAELYAKKAREIAEATGDTRQLALALYHVAWAELRNEQPQLALELGHQALAIMRGHEGPIISRCKGMMGLAYEQLGDYDQARAFLSEALEYNRATKNIPQMSTLLNNLGYVANMQGEWSAALQFLREALQAARESGATLNEIYVLTNLAQTLNSLGDHQTAEAEARRGAALCEAGGIIVYADFGIALADALRCQGRVSEAMAAAEQALDTARTSEGPREVAVALKAWGLALAANNDLATARLRLAESAELFEQIGTMPELGRLWRAWAKVELRAGDPVLGGELWAKARDLFTTHNLRFELERTPTEPSL